MTDCITLVFVLQIFFECPLSSQCLQMIKNWMGIRAISKNYLQFLSWIKRRLQREQILEKRYVSKLNCTPVKSLAGEE